LGKNKDPGKKDANPTGKKKRLHTKIHFGLQPQGDTAEEGSPKSTRGYRKVEKGFEERIVKEF